MLDFLGFGRAKGDRSEYADTLLSPRPVQGEYPTATQREMVRLTLHTLLKRHGIPAAWLGAEIGAYPTLLDANAILLQLVVQHWHPGFGLYAPSIQAELLDGIRRFDPTANSTRYHIHWKFSAECGYPVTPLPASGYWTGSAPASAAARQTQPTPAPKPKFDLPDPRDDDDPDNGFAATQMHDIR